MKKYFSFLAICILVSFGIVFGAPEDQDATFQTFNETGITNANIAANGVVNVSAWLPDGKLLIGGDFTLYKGVNVNRLARINNDGTLDTTFNPIVAPLTTANIGITGGVVNTIAIVPGGTAAKYSIIVGGAFAKFNNVVQNRLAKIDCTSSGCTLDSSFSGIVATSGANAAVNTIIFAPGSTPEKYTVIVGGAFTKYAGFNQNYISRITCEAPNPCVLQTNTFSAGSLIGFNGAVNALALVPEGTSEAYSIIVGGAFTKYNNTVQNRLAKLNCTPTTCTFDTALVGTATSNGANNIINTLALIPGGDSANYSMLIGGTFTKFDNIVQNRLAKISCSNDSGGLVCSLEEDFVGTTANDGANGAVETIAIYNNGIVVVGGAFSKYGNIARNRIAQIEAGGTVDDGFYNITPAGPDNTVQHLLIQPDGKIIVSGLFDSYTGLFTGRLTRLLGMTSSYSAEGCADGLFYCGFDNSCVANASQCASCPADFVQQTATITPATITPQVVPAVGTWGNLASSPSKHAAQAMVVLGTKIYVFGGYMNTATEVYDITSNTWQTLAPYPGSTNPYGIMAAAYNGKIYTFYQKKTYEYNPANDTWTEKAPIPTSKAQGSAEVIDDKIYIASSLSDKKFHIYDPLRNRWTAGPDIPVSMHYTEAAVSEGKLYILGGTIGEHGTHKMVHVYDPCAQSWRKISDMTLASATHSSTTVKGEIYLGGGVPIMDRGEPVFKKFRKYNPVTGVSTQLPDMPFLSYHARSVAVGNMIYALGGCGTSGLTTQYCTDRHAGFAVYNTGATNLNINDNISACYCKAACGEGKYYSLYDNTCKPNRDIVADIYCNNNNICDAGESCNCGDCVNGGVDDSSVCGVASGVQMYCSQDQDFYLPSTEENTKSFTDRQTFIDETNSAIFSYDYVLPGYGKTGAKRTTTTSTFSFPLPDGSPNSLGLSIKSLGAVSVDNTYISISYRDEKNFKQRGVFSPSGAYFGVSGVENIDFNFTKPIKSFGVDMYESTSAAAEFCNSTCVQSTFTFTAYLNGVQVGTPQTFSPADNQVVFFGFSAPSEFNQVRVRETTGGIDNERFGRIYYQDRSAGKQQCEVKKVLMTSTAAYPDNNYMIFYDYTPREIVYGGKKIYVYNPIGNTTQSLAAITADPSLAYSKIKKFTTPFQFMDSKLNSTNSVNIFKDTGFGPVPSALLCYTKPDGTERCQYDNAQVGYPVFARTPSTGLQTDVVYATLRDDPGSVTYARADIVRAFDIDICRPADSDVCSIGACCPAGKKWDCDTNACIVDEFMCPAGQIKTPDPGGATCLLSILPKTNGSDLFLTAYDNLQGNCTLASSSTNPIGTISPIGGTGLTVSSSLNTVVATTTLSFGTILNPISIENLLTCPTGQKNQCFLGDNPGQFSCGCFPETSLRMKVNIIEADNVNTTVTLGNGVKVQNNAFFDVYKNSTYALDTGFTTGDTTDMGVNRQQGYVEFYTHDRLKYQNALGEFVLGRLRGTITLEGAKIIGIDAPYQKSVTLHLESSTNDFATQLNDNTVSFSSSFSEPGDKWKVYYELPQNIPEAPVYTCQIQGCGEGKYWCSNEGICKNAGEACGVLTCNNDMVCDTEESCDCSDCNSQIDHCGVSVTGQQLYCATDSNTPVVCQNQAENTFNLIEAKLAPYLSQPGNLNIAAGEFGTAQTELEMTQDTRQDNAPSFTKEESWSRVKELLSLPVSTKVLWTRSSNLYSNNAYGGSHRYVHSFVIEDSLGDQRQITYATEYLQAYGWRKVYLVNKVFPLFDNAGKCLTSNNTDKWEAYSYASNYIFLAKHPIVKNTVAGKDFYIYNPERVIYNMTKQQFLANPTAAINNARVIPIGNTRTPASRLQFNMTQLLAENSTPNGGVQAITINNLKSSILSRFLCKTPGINSTDCHSNNLGAFIPGFSYTPTDTIYSSIHDGSGFVQTTAYQRFGTFDVACQPYDYTTVRYIPNTNPSTQGWSLSDLAGSAKNDAGKLVWQVADTSTTRRGSFSKKLSSQEVTDFFTKGGNLSAEIKNITSGTTTTPGDTEHLISSHLELSVGQTTNTDGSVRPRKRFTLAFGMEADRTPIVYALTDGAYNGTTPYRYRVTGGVDKYNKYEMIYDPATYTVDIFVNGVERISNYPGNTVTSGNLQSINQIGVYFGSGSSLGIATTNYGEVKLNIKNNACTASAPAVAQIGACCPAGAQWNSDENKCLTECMGDTTWDEAQNKCVPNGCAEGQYYCHAELKCKPANETCGTVTCNNNGTCDFNESCDCADCNGQIDHCGIVGGQQLYCAKDPAPQCYTDRFPYCFPICLDGYTMNGSGQCVASGGTSISASSATLTTTQIGACCPTGAQWSFANNKCETNCNTTQAPSELKAGIDQPYITCTAGPSGTTHFRYRLTDVSAPTATPFISAIYANGTPVLHPVINAAGTYKVECFYGSATSVDTSNTATPSTCTKNITVKNDANTQGCEGLVSYKGTTLTTTLEDTNVFTARFQCINRVSENPLLSNPFRIQYGNNTFMPLGFATVIDPNLSSSIGLNRLSAQNEYTFGVGQTSVTCAVKVGEGYSTNLSCQKNACVGGNCSTPQTFSVIHSDNLTCTTQATAEYKIGCNPDAPQTNRTDCVNWLRQMANNATSFKAPFIFNGTLYGNGVDCTIYSANDPALGGVNMYDNIVCKATLNNGQQYTILAADTGGNAIASLQTTTYTVKKDTTDPDLLPLELYLNPTLTLQVTDFDRWYNVPVTLVARCSDLPGISDGDECACAQQIFSEPTLWSTGVAHTQFGPDIMYYTRTISASTNNIAAQVQDTAGNKSAISPQISLNIDTQPPVVAITETGSGASRTIQLSVTDTNSKIWTTTTTPSGGKNDNGLLYRTGPKADAQTLMLDNDCSVAPVSLLPTVAQTVTIPNNRVITIPNINTSNTVITYCVKDNAGNVTRGSYPTVSNACFSASNMPTVPNFDTYKDLLIPRLSSNKYGYSFSENTADAQCFRGILANNVATLIANQLTPRTETSLDNWDTSRAVVKNSSNRNTNGYYYYSYTSNDTLKINTSPSDAGTKTVVVDGGNIQITQDINYSGTGKLLVLIARKNNNGQGGNILIDPTVSNIDAILIADGGALTNTDTNALGERLIINGRVYSYNTRGGSLAVAGSDLADATTAKKYNNASLINATSFAESRAQDLERFRTMSVDGNTQCSLHINYQVLTNSQLPPILQRPTSFGGSCGF